jgi:hypothetical protein
MPDIKFPVFNIYKLKDNEDSLELEIIPAQDDRISTELQINKEELQTNKVRLLIPKYHPSKHFV